MKESSTCVIHDPCFLRVLIALNRWESSDENEFQPASCRELFHLIAESILDNAHGPKYQTLKFLSGRLTDRAIRQRVREFEMRGLITPILLIRAPSNLSQVINSSHYSTAM